MQSGRFLDRALNVSPRFTGCNHFDCHVAYPVIHSNGVVGLSINGSLSNLWNIALLDLRRSVVFADCSCRAFSSPRHKRSSYLFPRFTPGDVADSDVCYSVVPSDSGEVFSIRAAFTDINDVLVFKICASMSFPTDASWMFQNVDCVSNVLTPRNILKVIEAVVCFVSIFVIYFMVLGFMANEAVQYQLMDTPCFCVLVVEQVYMLVALFVCCRFHNDWFSFFVGTDSSLVGHHVSIIRSICPYFECVSHEPHTNIGLVRIQQSWGVRCSLSP